MTSEVFATLFSLILVQPFSNEVRERLTAAGASPESFARLTECARIAPGLLAERAWAAPGWAAGTALKVWLGDLPAATVLGEITPSCANIGDAAKPGAKA